MSLTKQEIQEIENKISEQDVYTAPEAADCLNVFPNTVICWIDKGYLKCFRTPGGHRRIPKEELLHFVRNHRFHRNLKKTGIARILIVEDDEDARKLYQNILSKKEYEIKAVENGFFAGVIKDFKPDLVILDILLPDIDGEDVCKFIKSSDDLKNTKIMAVSAISDRRRINRLFAAGIAEFLGKPFEVGELEKKVEALLAA